MTRSEPVPAPPVPVDVRNVGVPDCYRILKLIGAGAFGLVYLAEQLRPVQRRVAIKVLKPGVGSETVAARFEDERQALALMSHPAVAKVFEAGTTSAGLPYFVMEYVAGLSITRFCDRHRLTLDERLELFLRVCDAIKHAHQKAVIHRDIKPSNVLVEDVDGKPEPKVIDFGVAKALEGRLAERSFATEHGQLIGTPDYMSPEQADLDHANVDTRSDVYSLGVMLYELISGVRPFDFGGAGMTEIHRILTTAAAPRPSARLAEADDADAIAAARRTTRAELLTRLRRELEWIPVRALRRDPRERYDTVAALATDVRHYLAGRPLLAGPESAMYRVRKFVRRNRVQVVAATVVVGALLVAAVGLGMGLTWAAAEAREAEARQQEAARVLRMWSFLLPFRTHSEGMFVDAESRLHILDGIRRRAEGMAAAGELLARDATVWQILGIGYQGIGHYDTAETMYRRALEGAAPLESSVVVVARIYLAETLDILGRYDEAATVLDQIDAMEKGFERSHLIQYENFRDMTRIRILRGQGRLDEAEALARGLLDRLVEEAPPMGDDAGVGVVRSHLATILQRQGRLDEAEREYLETLAMQRDVHRVGGDDTRRRFIVRTLYNLVSLYNAQARFEEALPLAEEALAECGQWVDPGDRAVSLSRLQLGICLAGLGRLEEAETELSTALAQLETTLGPDHAQTLEARRHLADLRGGGSG